LIERIGIRPSLDPNAPVVHSVFRRASALWFEFMKRVGVLAALKAASARSWEVKVVYVVTLFFLMSPLSSWVEKWEIDFKERGRMGGDGSENSMWKYSFPLAVLSTILGMALVNFILQTFVSSLLAELGGDRR
jgi:hypothetical protein